MKATTKRAHIVYSGMVQGVGFRFTAQRIALSLGLQGWVRNCPDGTVEVMCEGEEKKIDLFMNKLKDAMSNYIRSADISWSKASGEFNAFDVVYYN